MASAQKNLSAYDENNLPSAAGMSFGIVVADWNADVTHAMYEGCLSTLLKHGANEDDIRTAQVPGSFELPVGAKILAGAKRFDAIICLGCVVKGETQHDEFINHAVANGLVHLSIASGIPCIFGVLTTYTQEQAQDRAGGIHGNKGVEAATTAIRMAAMRKEIGKPTAKIGFQ